jgi:hypothetical protein
MTYDDVTQSLLEYLYSKAEEYADVGNEGALSSLFDRSDSFLDGEAYEEIKYKMYAKVTIKVIYSRKETYSVASMIDYINTNFEKTGYDCWVNEFWYYFEFIQRSERGETTEDTDVYHKKSSGYLLENSDKEMLVIGDISHLTKHELYLALYEIYARHGRMFSDSTVQNYFDNCSWYTPTIIQDDFDESILNEYERANRNLIVEYEMNMGYR